MAEPAHVTAPDGTRLEWVITADADVTPGAECPACGRTGCEIVHTKEQT